MTSDIVALSEFEPETGGGGKKTVENVNVETIDAHNRTLIQIQCDLIFIWASIRNVNMICVYWHSQFLLRFVHVIPVMGLVLSFDITIFMRWTPNCCHFVLFDCLELCQLKKLREKKWPDKLHRANIHCRLEIGWTNKQSYHQSG